MRSPAPDAARIACALAFSVLGGVIPAAVFSGPPVHARAPQHIGTDNGMVMQASHLSQFLVPDPHRLGRVARRRLGRVALGDAHASPRSVAAGLAVGRFERRLTT